MINSKEYTFVFPPQIFDFALFAAPFLMTAKKMRVVVGVDHADAARARFNHLLSPKLTTVATKKKMEGPLYHPSFFQKTQNWGAQSND